MAFLFRHASSLPPPPPPPPPPLDLLLQRSLANFLSGSSRSTDAAPGNGQVAEKGTLAAVADSIRRCVSGMSPWDISDLTLGLYKISTRHALEGTSDTISGSPVVEKQELQELLYWLDWAWASYHPDEKSVISFLKIKEDQLKKHVKTSAILKPSYFIALDDAKGCVIISIRGTYAATDVLTDLQPHSEQFEGGFAHSGMLSAARWILENETDNLQTILSENPGYKLILTGHSLGAGAASLLGFLLRESQGSRNQRVSLRLGVPSSMIECWGFGCPPCVDKNLSEQAIFIKNVVLQDDIVARASVAALEDLRSEILQTDWAHVLQDGSMAKKMLGLVNSTQSALGNVEQALGYEQGSFYQQAKSLSYAAMVNSFRESMFRGQYAPHGPPGHYGMHGLTESYTMHGPPGYYGMRGPPPPHGLQGPTPQILTGLLSFGAAAVSSYFQTPDSRNQAQVASISNEASDIPTSTSREFMEGGRLFVPGILYHIRRNTIEEKDSLTLSNLSSLVIETKGLAVGENTDTEVVKKDKSTKQENKLKADTGKSTAAMRHIIVRASDPTLRFMKIVLSKSMLSDHSLVAYKEGIQDAIHWTKKNSPFDVCNSLLGETNCR